MRLKRKKGWFSLRQCTTYLQPGTQGWINTSCFRVKKRYTWYTIKYRTTDLISQYTKEPLVECVYNENSSHGLDIKSRFITRKNGRTIVFYTSENVQRGPEGYSHISEHFLKFPEDCRWNLNVLMTKFKFTPRVLFLYISMHKCRMKLTRQADSKRRL